MRIPIVMMVITLLCSLLVDLYIYYDIRRFYHKRKGSGIYLATSVALWIYIIVTLCLPRRGENSILPVMWMLYAYLTVYVPKFIYVIVSLIGRIPCLLHRRAWRSGMFVGLPLALLTFVIMWYGAIFGREKIHTERVEIISPKIPEAFDGYKIVQFSDAHVGTWGSDTIFISRLVDSINSLKPDLIVFTGDIVNRRTDEIYPFVGPLRRLHAKDGVWSILGNHDYGDYADWPSQESKNASRKELVDIQNRMGWKMLNNSHTFLHSRGDSIALIGTENWGEPPFPEYGNLKQAYSFTADSLKGLTDGHYKILLTHNPVHWEKEVLPTTNIDLTLSGHTHAMQMMISAAGRKWSPASLRYNEWGGLYEGTNADGKISEIYVNIGCGEVGMPYRIGANPEITLITLRNGQRQ